MSIALHVHAVAWPLRLHSLILNFDCMCHASNVNLINPLAKVQHVVAKAKRTLESNNPVMYELKQLCGPKLLEKRKSNPKKPVEPEGGFIAQFSASRRLKLHTSTLHAGPDDAAQPARIDTQSTLAMDSQGLPAPPAAPKFLEAVLSDLESRPSTCFDHAKQYKKQFRELIKQGQGSPNKHGCRMIYLMSFVCVHSVF